MFSSRFFSNSVFVAIVRRFVHDKCGLHSSFRFVFVGFSAAFLSVFVRIVLAHGVHSVIGPYGSSALITTA